MLNEAASESSVELMKYESLIFWLVVEVGTLIDNHSQDRLDLFRW